MKSKTGNYRTREDLDYAMQLCLRIKNIRTCYVRLINQDTPKEILDLLLRTRIRLESKNYWRH